MLEVEVKLPVKDLDAVRATLERLGARHIDDARQADTYFAHPQRDFRETDEALRVRETPAGREVTYKGPRHDAAAKIRTEVNVAFDGDLEALLVPLSFAPVARVLKERSSWMLDGAAVALDRVADIGTFVEVEVVSDEPSSAEAKVQSVVAALGLDGIEPERRSYLELQASS